MQVENAINRLGKILPIKHRLDALDAASASVYLAVVNGFYNQGRAPTLEELQAAEPNAEAIVAQLAGQDMLTLDETGQVKGCYPFTMEQRVHRININGHTVQAMCALDALSVGLWIRSPGDHAPLDTRSTSRFLICWYSGIAPLEFEIIKAGRAP